MSEKRCEKLVCVVNGLSLVPPVSGVGRVTLELSKRLFGDGSDWKPLYYYGYYSSRLMDLGGMNGGSEIKRLALRFVRSNYVIKSLARKALNFYGHFRNSNATVYWEPNHVLLKHIRARVTLLTIHDLSCVFYPQWHPKERLDFWESNFRRGVEKADMIVTVSDTIRKSVLEYTGLHEERVAFIHNGVDHELFRPLPDACLADFRARHNLPARFFLCVGSIEPRKNLKNLLVAWLSLPYRVRGECKLLLIANSGWKNEDIMKLITDGEESGSVALIRDVASFDMPFYYGLAEVFLYLSFYEGFGLPPLEAMACGAPVLVSDIPVHREILAGAAMYVSPSDASIIAERLEDLLINSPSASGACERSLRAALYSWDKSAAGYAAIMESLNEKSERMISCPPKRK